MAELYKVYLEANLIGTMMDYTVYSDIPFNPTFLRYMSNSNY